jgi:hypothetical protein
MNRFKEFKKDCLKVIEKHNNIDGFKWTQYCVFDFESNSTEYNLDLKSVTTTERPCKNIWLDFFKIVTSYQYDLIKTFGNDVNVSVLVKSGELEFIIEEYCYVS